MRKLRILSAAILQAIVALSAALSSTNASAATPIPSGIYSYEDIGETGTVNIAFNNKGELWFYAFVINEDGHTAELTPENGAWIPMKGNKFSYNLKTDILDYTLEVEFFPDEQLLELKDNFNAGGTPFGMGMGLAAHYRYEGGSFATSDGYMYELIDEALTQMNIVLSGRLEEININATAGIEQRINDLRNSLKKQNIANLDNQTYSYELGTVLNDLIEECEQTGDYIVNVVEARVGSKLHEIQA